MKAVQLVQPGLELELRETEVPRPGLKDALIRVKAAGICHSDAHYRAGRSAVAPLPLTLGHEVAGVVEMTGAEVKRCRVGDRVCLHYLATCGRCQYCLRGTEQFCPSAVMLGKQRDGGYAEYVLVPESCVFGLPERIPFEQGAIMMCSSATSLHALKKARLKAGESVAIFGAGGLGLSAIQLAKALGADEVFAVDIEAGKLETAKKLGANPINGSQTEAVEQIRRETNGRGVDVSLELIGLPSTMQQAVRVLAIQGRAALAGITEKGFEVAPYFELIGKEAEIIGVSDHLGDELPALIDMVSNAKLDLSGIVKRVIPLEARMINETLDRLEQFREEGRVVIRP